jgi:O-succinylbenzoic acid--CoA ligase
MSMIGNWRDADAPALITASGSLSYRTLDCLVEEKRRTLRARRCYPTVARSDVETIVLLLAALRQEAAVCLLSHRLPQQARDATVQNLSAPPGVATMLLTSGTSGAPKMACHSLENFYFSALGFNAAAGLSPEHRWLLSLPLFHVGGLAILFRCFLAGAAVVLPEAASPAMHASIVPTHLYRMLQEGAFPYAYALLGGAPCSPLLLREARSLGWNIHLSYGMTETTATCTLDGAPLPYRRVRGDPDGEILVAGETLFQGYWTPEEGLSLPLDAEGWFATRDLGSWGPDGALAIVGRKDRLFISGGENIQPEEIERALLMIPGVSDAHVFPVDDPEFGKRPAAAIADTSGLHTLASIREALAPLLPAFKLPVRLSPLPRHRKLYL